MRIALFTESYEPVVNGVSVSVATLRDGLRSRGHEVLIFAPRYPGYEDAEGVYRFNSTMTPYGYALPIPFAPRMRYLFSTKLKPDIVHTQTPFFLGVMGMRWARMIDAPIISTNHTLYHEYVHYVPVIPRSMTRSVLIWHMQRYYGNCSAVIVPSRTAEGVLRGYGIETDAEIIKSGITMQPEGGGDELRRSFNIPKDAFLLLYVGRIAKEKNLQMLIKAFNMVRQKHPHVRLLVVGSGPYERGCREYAEEQGVDGITFAGMLSHDEVAKSYCAADAFVFPSVTETQGIVLGEAMMVGLPSIAVKAAATPEVLEDGVDGLLTPNSAFEFAQSIMKIVSNPELRSKLSEGAKRNSSKFTIDAMAEQVESLYLAEIEKRKRG